jgi:hypothetical protein
MNLRTGSEEAGRGDPAIEPSRWWSSQLRWLVAVLAVIAFAAVVTIWLTWDPEVERETGKTALSVLAASVFGTLVALVVDRYRRDRDRREDGLEDERRREADARWREAEAGRQEADRQRDDRQRQDIQLRALLEETVRTYNSVKETRRLLKARCLRAHGQAITVDVYDSRMRELIRLQLRFEEFKRAARVKPDRLGIAPAASGFREMERYLNEVIDEYLVNRHQVEEGGAYSLASLPRLAGFLRSYLKDEDGQEIGFNPHMSHQIRHIVRVVQGQLLRPSEAPESHRSHSPARRGPPATA